MADAREKEAKQRLVKLAVREISLVDAPANEEEFVVVKHANGVAKAVWSTAKVNDLPDSSFLHVEPGGSKDADGKTVPRTNRMFPVKGPDGQIDLPHLRNALARIPQANISQDLKDRLTTRAQRMLEEETSEDKMSTKGTENTEGTQQQPPPEAKTPPPAEMDLGAVTKSLVDLTTELEKGGKMPDAMRKAMTSLRTMLSKMLGGDEEDMDKDTKKSKGADKTAETLPGTHIHIAPDGTVVLKGAKQFSTERRAQLRTAVQSLMGVMKETDPEALAQLQSELGIGPAPTTTPAPAPAATPAGPPPEVSAELTKMNETLAGISKRLDALEKTPVSKSLPADTTDKPVDKSKSFWHGVL